MMAQTYPFKGRLVGRFYNKRGEASRMSRLLAERAATAKSHEEKQREYEAQFPPCNVRWTEAEGGWVRGLRPWTHTRASLCVFVCAFVHPAAAVCMRM